MTLIEKLKRLADVPENTPLQTEILLSAARALEKLEGDCEAWNRLAHERTAERDELVKALQCFALANHTPEWWLSGAPEQIASDALAKVKP